MNVFHFRRARREFLPVVILWAWYAVGASVLAVPVSQFVSTAYGSHPHGDGVLWGEGGLELAQFLFRSENALPLLYWQAIIVTMLIGATALVPTAFLFVSLASEHSGGARVLSRDRIARAVSVLGRFAFLWAATLLLQLVLIFVISTVARSVNQNTITFGLVAADVIGATFLLCGLLICASLGAVHDLARAMTVEKDAKNLDAFILAGRILWKKPLTTLTAWASRTLLGWVPIALAFMVATRLGGKGGTALVVLGVSHQLAIFTKIAVRASWFAYALKQARNS